MHGVLGAGSGVRVGWRGGGASGDFYWCWGNFHFGGGGGGGTNHWATILLNFSDFPNIS